MASAQPGSELPAKGMSKWTPSDTAVLSGMPQSRPWKTQTETGAMALPYELVLGWRYTRAGRATRRNGFISFISGVSMLGIALGVAALIIVLSVMNGFDHEMRTRVLGMVPHATLETGEAISDWPSLAAKVKQNPQVLAVAPFTQMQGLLTNDGKVSKVTGAAGTVYSPGKVLTFTATESVEVTKTSREKSAIRPPSSVVPSLSWTFSMITNSGAVSS